jgi:poly(glycerol-phosphate) alpha-glucosyltransferase
MNIQQSARRVLAATGTTQFAKRVLRKAGALGPRPKTRTVRIDPVPAFQPFPQARYIFAVGAIPRRYAGRTASVLAKAKLFSEQAGVPCEILTMNYSAELDDVTHDIEERGALGRGVRIVNLYDSLMTCAEASEPIHHPVEEPGMDSIKDPDAPVYRYYEGGVYRLYKRFDYAGRLIVRDWFNENRGRTRRDEFGADGRIRRTTYYDLHYNKPRQEVYFRSDGTAFMNKWLVVNPADLTTDVERITLFDEHERPTKVLTSHIELIQDYLDRMVGDDHVFLSVESRRTDPEVIDYRRPNVKRLYVLHNPHTTPPFRAVNKIRQTYRPVLDRHAEADAIVFLTAAQRADAEAHYGRRNNFWVIPHPVSLPAEPSTAPRDPHLVVMLARLDQQKNVDHAIRAFQHVVRKAPQARLEIYGRGPEEKNLRALIRELRLERSVTLAGYTTDPGAVYDRASACLLTSSYEGFGLVVLEAIAHGCPVVSYDLSYGPSDIIEQGVTGYLVPQADTGALAERTLRILNDPQARDETSARCRESALRFSPDAYLARWSDLFNRLDAKGWG